MKDNKVTFYAIVGMVVVALLMTVYFFSANVCEADGTTICYDRSNETFKIEQGSYLNVQVESEAQGEYLVNTWNTLHPDYKDAIVYAVKKPLSATELSQGIPYDVNITSLEAAAYFIDDFYDMKNLSGVIGSRIPTQLEGAINVKGFYFIPNSIKGPVFVYNKTLMEELGYNTEDTNGSGLPDAFETWEQIIEETPNITQEINVVYPLTFVDQNSFYPYLTSGHWRLFLNRDSMNPGFDSKEFLNGLDFITAMSEIVLDKATAEIIQPVEEEVEENVENSDNIETIEDTNTVIIEEDIYINSAESLIWQYEESFYNRQSMFTLIDPDTTLFNEYRQQTTDEYVISKMPTFKNNNMSPMASVYGYVVNKEVKFPSAAAEVIRILRTPEAISLYKSENGTYPIYNSKYIDELTIEDNEVLQYIKAYNYHDTPSVLALTNNPQVLARDLYKEIDIMEPLRQLYNGEIDKELAQQQIIEKVNEWYASKEIVEE